MKVGLVLEGGGMRGIYTSGVLDIFLENNIEVDGIIGVSAGVLFGVNYLSKQKGRAIRYNKKYASNKNYMRIYSLLKTGNIVNKDFAYYQVPFKEDKFDNDTYKKSKVPFYAVITNVKTGLAEYIKIKDVFKDMEVLRASSSMPMVSKMVEINNEYYLDGAVGDSIPFNKMMDLGYDKLIVVLTKYKGYKKKKMFSFIPKLFYRKYPSLVESIINRPDMYNKQMEELEKLERSGKLIVIRPSRKIDIKRIESNKDKLQEMYDLGVNDTKKEIKKIYKYINDNLGGNNYE